MKLMVLGSAAAECCPALWCTCDNCRTAWKRKGKDLRRRTSYLIDDDTWVDFGPDSFNQAISFFDSWPKLRQIFFTHCHPDHLDPTEIYWRHEGFSKVDGPVSMYAMPAVFDRLQQVFCVQEAEQDFEKLQLIKQIITPGVLTPAQNNMEFFAIPADHGAPESINLFFRKNGKSILIANDTGYWKPESWELASQLKADIVVIDGTCALTYPNEDNGHMGANTVVRFRDELLKRGIITKKSIAVVNHFSHNAVSLQEELEKFFVPHGILVGFDGMTLEA